MLTLIILAPIVLALFLLPRIIRLLFFPFRRQRGWNRGSFGGRGIPYTNNYNPYARARFGGLGSILFLVALDRLFGRRW